MAKKTGSRLYIIDGNSYIFRAFFAIPPLSTSRGLPTNAVYGFTTMMKKVVEDYQPTHLVITFDTKEPTFRHKRYEEYKANRPEPPEELVPQFSWIQKVVEGYNLPSLRLPGYEADDLIGTLARQAREQGMEVVIISGDKDIFQLLSPGVTMIDTMKDLVYSEEEVRKKFGVDPDKITEVMGLMGDSSDNIPGVPGIGLKTATALIQEFGSIDKLLEKVDQVKRKKVQELLRTYEEQAKLSRELATIDVNVPVELDLEAFAYREPDREALFEIFKELEFTKWLKDFSSESSSPAPRIQRISKPAQWKKVRDRVNSAGSFSFHCLLTSGDPFSSAIASLGLSAGPEDLFCFELEAASSQGDLFSSSEKPSTGSAGKAGKSSSKEKSSVEENLGHLRDFLEDEALEKCCHDMKPQMMALARRGIHLRGKFFDTMMASYLLNPSKPSHGLEDLAWENFQSRLPGLDKEKEEEGLEGAGFRAAAIRDLSRMLREKLDTEELEELFSGLEMPLVEVLAEMETNGVKVDSGFLNSLSREFENSLRGHMKEIYKLAGEEFNINSPKQLSRILFEKLELPVIKKTKTGYSTNVDVLERLSEQHELPSIILSYRSLMKLKSTYVDALIQMINPHTGRIHTSYNQAVTATGRLSSSDPNLQNIPIRTAEGRRIRRAFIAEKGHLLLSADYSQVELRVLAHVAGAEELIRAFLADEDIHRKTAGEVFGVEPSQVSDEMRRTAKVINFGVIYGMSDYGLAQQLKISAREAQLYIESYFVKYPGVKAYMERSIEEARKQGYVSTILGRKRWLPEINARENNTRKFAERMAINTPIQGSAADIIKIAMIRIHRRLQEEEFSGRMIMQVHDELVFEVPKKEIQKTADLVKEEMEGAAELQVPLRVDVNWGENWDDAH